jgi:hypothetical protein
MYCGTCGRGVLEADARRSSDPGCGACRPEPGVSPTKRRNFPVIRRPRSRGTEDPLTGILLNAVLVAVGALLLVAVTPRETSAEQKAGLEATLANIREIRDSDPDFARSAEVLALFDSAGSVAGLKRTEVNRLREEYRREIRGYSGN